jgi:hypothetical protein
MSHANAFWQVVGLHSLLFKFRLISCSGTTEKKAIGQPKPRRGAPSSTIKYLHSHSATRHGRRRRRRISVVVSSTVAGELAVGSDIERASARQMCVWAHVGPVRAARADRPIRFSRPILHVAMSQLITGLQLIFGAA